MGKERSKWWAVAYLFTVIPNIYLWGFTFVQMWSWFLVGTLRVHPVSVWQAIGILMTIRYVTIDWDKKVTLKKDQDFGKLMARDVFVPLIFLGIGWVIQHFM